MCGRFGLSRPVAEILRFFDVDGSASNLLNLEPSWNIAPTTRQPVLRRNPETGVRQLDKLKWGIQPGWMKAGGRPPPINARSETAASLPTFRSAYKARRCLVPMDVYFEWRVLGPKAKQAYAIARTTGEPLAAAGIWESFTGADGEVVRTFAILTTEANGYLSRIHDRMPVFPPRESWDAWLACETGSELLQPAPDDWVRAWPISSDVNKVANNGPHLLDEVVEPAPGGGPNPA